MLKRNLISIIIPVYNASAFISNTIDNLLAQEVEKELLLVNDGSTDNSLNILNDYAQKYSCIKVLNQTNQGVSSARNHAIEVAQGEFLIFVSIPTIKLAGGDLTISGVTIATVISCIIIMQIMI